MHTPFGHLTYCTNIHAGESWTAHFAALQEHVPVVKQTVCPDQPFGIGLRLSNAASLDLQQEEALQAFAAWLKEQQCYVFTLNGFPYGAFHQTAVKDAVHAPDWTTAERADYTIRLAQLLAALLPQGMEGGISTSPLSYRHWHPSYAGKDTVFKKATANVVQTVKALIRLKEETGKTIHLDIEPEPDGLLETSAEFVQWYNEYLLPIGNQVLNEELQLCKADAVAALKEHVQLCYDVCHFAIGFENAAGAWQQLRLQGIKIGKIQLSAALKGTFSGEPAQKEKLLAAFRQFNEPTYLHQVVSRESGISILKRYPDLPQALDKGVPDGAGEWRVHYHVPLFTGDFDPLQSTQAEVAEVLGLQRQHPATTHLEVETYTWEVLPENLKLPLSESIARELAWVQQQLLSNR